MRAGTVSNYGAWVKGCTLEQALRSKEVTIILSWRDWYRMTLVSIYAAPQLWLSQNTVTDVLHHIMGSLLDIPAAQNFEKIPIKNRNIQWARGLADSIMLSLLCLNVSFKRAMARLGSNSKSAYCGHIISTASLWSYCLCLRCFQNRECIIPASFSLMLWEAAPDLSLDVFTCLP